MSFPTFLLILSGLPVFSIAFAFLISQWSRLATITIFDGSIHGQGFWGTKKKIPLSDITSLTPFSNNGINAIVVNSKLHGQIYISDKTE